MSSDERFVLLATFATGLDADVAKAALELEGIPVLVKGPQVGMFGASFQGNVLGGVELHVPAGALPRAQALTEL
jgi:hypothetical protein